MDFALNCFLLICYGVSAQTELIIVHSFKLSFLGLLLSVCLLAASALVVTTVVRSLLGKSVIRNQSCFKELAD